MDVMQTGALLGVATCFCKVTVNIRGFGGIIVSIAATHLYCCFGTATREVCK